MAVLLPLSRWHERPPKSAVAVSLGQTLDQQTLQSRVSRWIETLQARQGQRWAVHHSDSFEFLCILLALWQLGRTACIPSDNRPATLARLSAELDGLAGEFDASGAVSEPAHEPASRERNWTLPAADFVALEIYTSGSTGEPKSIAKGMNQLEREIEAIETLWPGDDESVVLATVSHQHIYGMTFGLFRPFSTGRAFESRACELIEDIRYKAGLYQRFALVSSPSHLGRFGDSIDWSEIAGRCEYVISSAAPLTRADSLKLGRLLGTEVREIYGSSETGAIAWRIQRSADTDANWRALPGVSLAATKQGTLELRSPYLGDLESFELPDRVAFDEDGGFELLGRVDSIVKVEGKRVSVAAIEQQLLHSDWVDQVRVLTLERARVETAVVARLSPPGQAMLQAEGRRALIGGLRDMLAQSFEAVVIPRRWRFVEQMPFNRQGKLPLDSLRALFDPVAGTRLEILRQEISSGQARLHCRIPAQLIYFDGHMPGRPILPGIVQVHWAENLARELLAIGGRFERLEAVKFQQVILPEYEVTISLNYDDANGKLSFRYESERGVHSSGRICFSR